MSFAIDSLYRISSASTIIICIPVCCAQQHGPSRASTFIGQRRRVSRYPLPHCGLHHKENIAGVGRARKTVCSSAPSCCQTEGAKYPFVCNMAISSLSRFHYRMRRLEASMYVDD
jgi:hypothetical protein